MQPLVTLVVRGWRSGGGQRDSRAGSPAVTVIWGDYDLPLQLVARHTMEISIRRRAADIAGQYTILLHIIQVPLTLVLMQFVV